MITKMPNASQYIECVESWIDLVLKCFGHRELNTVLGDIIKVSFQISFTVHHNTKMFLSCFVHFRSVAFFRFRTYRQTDRSTDLWICDGF